MAMRIGMAHGIALDHRFFWSPDGETRVRVRPISRVTSAPAWIALAFLAALIPSDARLEPLYASSAPSELAVTPPALAQASPPSR